MIPYDLMNDAVWCTWKRETRDGKPTKVPYNPLTGRRAETNNPETFTTFQIAEEAFKIDSEYDGIGILVSNGFSAVDIDHCIENGEISDFAKDICAKMNSYTEKSPSGTGLRIIICGDNLSYDKTKYYLKNPNNGVELYLSGMTNRFMTITGNTLLNLPIRRVTSEELTEFLDQYMQRQKKSVKDTPLTDDQIIEKASKNAKFEALFRGDITEYNNDHSSADLALCNILAFWTGKNATQMDRIFRRSGLYRDKWERDDYKANTLQLAINQCSSTYDPLTARKIWDRLDSPVFDLAEWRIDSTGVYREAVAKQPSKQPQTIHVTSTPIVPVAYLENLDQGVHKVELHYLLNDRQKTLVCERETIANKNKIISLSNQGIDVTSENAAELVRYLANVGRLNPNAIPHRTSVSHVGWVDDKFVPYDDNILFDGGTENRALYRAIAQSGSYDEWVAFMRPLRQNRYLRLMMAASFASPLIEKVKALPFVFHLWGETGKGKTVALMIAMSIWGNPQSGQLTRTMNMTNASMMSTAAFLYNLPFAGDELQTIKELHASYDKLIMQITEGIERGRMQFNQNLPTRSWKCAFLFTGEERCTNDRSGGGTQNRVFEVEFTDKVVEDGAAAVRFISDNYGHAGRKFIEHIANRDIMRDYQELVDAVLQSCDTTDKQAATAALILLADKLACESIFKGDAPLTIADIAEFVKTNEEVVVSKRAYDYIVDWIAVNDVKFGGSSYGEVWGCKSYDGTSVWIIDSVLKSALESAGFSFDSVKKDWAINGWVVKYQNKFKKRKGINGTAPYCVEIRLPDC